MKKILHVFRYLCFFLGILAFLYPVASDRWNRGKSSQVVESYEKAVSVMNQEWKEKALKAAEIYNQILLVQTLFPTKIRELKTESYPEILNLDANGMMGYIEIPKIHVKLPIYHGTDEYAISNGAGHMEGSSLPVGGKGTHAVLSSHRGLPSARLFTDLDKLEKGDSFSITVLDRTIFYKVDEIRTVEPEETEWMKIEKEKEYCTLLTCTPYGINTHRLLIRGVRDKTEKVLANAPGRHWIWYGIAGSFLVILILLLCLIPGRNARAGEEKVPERGKIEIVCREKEKAVTGIEIQISKVENPIPGYKNFPEDRMREAAERLAKDKKRTAEQSQKTDESGKAVFSDLEMGCYLIWQKEPQVPGESFWKMQPFLVVIPVEEDGKWIANILAKPKIEKESGSKIKENPAVKTGDSGKSGGYILSALGSAVVAAGVYRRKRGKA